MMTVDQLQEVERLGGLMFSQKDVFRIMGLKIDELPEASFGPFDDAFQRGRLLKEAEVRKSIFEIAVAGSAPAQALAKQFIDQARVAAVSTR